MHEELVHWTNFGLENFDYMELEHIDCRACTEDLVNVDLQRVQDRISSTCSLQFTNTEENMGIFKCSKHFAYSNGSGKPSSGAYPYMDQGMFYVQQMNLDGKSPNYVVFKNFRGKQQCHDQVQKKQEKH